MRFLGLPLTSKKKARRAAGEFAELIGQVVNATISQAPISYVEITGDPFTCFIAHCPHRLAEPLRLVNGEYLYLYNALGLRRPERYLTTLEYRYTYQATAEDDSWIFRYEYLREPLGYPYPQCHLHVNAEPESYTGEKAFPALHLPTGFRVRIEDIVRHLIVEHDLAPISPNWEDAVSVAEKHFDEIRRKAMSSPDY